MESFEIIVAKLLENDGYWIRFPEFRLGGANFYV